MSDRASLTIGEEGLLEACKVMGGRVRVEGRFIHPGEEGLIRPTELVVTERGAVSTHVRQPEQRTRFGFSKGCRLRLKISNPGK